ncbi:MAG: methyl-accepting chemotaxis protein, partial [Lachnospiraceae bacterium]|nr:methyl-accepting chemotaxis protein [Lachnospiraceae bacterium]
GNILGADGISIFDGSDYSDRAYYATAMKGKTYITEPLISKVTGKLTIIIAAPLWEKGIPGTTVVGVVYFVPTETFLNDIVSSIKVGAGGGAFILDQTGLNIADKDIKVVTVESVIEKAKENSKLAEEAAIHKLMIAGKTGVDNFKDNKTGTTHIMAYAPINNTNSWSLGIYAVQSEFLGGVTEAIYITLGIALLAIIIATFVAFNFANKITKPIIGCAQHMKEIAAGDLSKDIPETNLKDETGMLMEGMASLLSEVRGSIGDVSWHLQEMGEGNFSHDVEREYIGDFAKLKTSMQQIITELNHVLHEIVESSNQVANGSEQVASGAQALSQGTTEQASSIEELSATISEIADQVKQNAKNAESASDMVSATGREVQTSNEKMQQLMDAMTDISDKSGEIGKIIKSIEDIAFQTNILALNAAVEAARAGEAGKGFAVVADEVRNLAEKSATAAKNTTLLIEASLKAIENGKVLADGTVESMVTLVESQEGVIDMVDQIKSASENQANAISQITLGIDQISSVIQNNSATAEESAAASEELSGQAEMQKELVSKFTLYAKK